MLYKSYEPMAEHCSFRSGGKARWFIQPKNFSELKTIIEDCNAFGRKFFILGNGTNVIFTDKGFSGVVICTKKLDDIQLESKAEGFFVTVSAGASLIKLNKFLADCGVSGMEWSYGIPGTVGGAIKMNAGAYGGQIFDHVVSVDVLKNGKVIKLKKENIKFSYRSGGIDDIILRAKLFFPLTSGTDIKTKQMEIMKRRIDSQPLNYPSAGSVFKRQENLIPAQIIDKLNLKGAIIGRAMVSEKHAGFIVNLGGATTSDFLKLVEKVQLEVKKVTGKTLELEVIIVGEK